MELQLLDNSWILRIRKNIEAKKLHSLGRFNSPYVVVQVISKTADPAWSDGGFIAQKISFQSIIAFASQQSIKLNFLSLLYFPNLLSSDVYELYYFAPKRLEKIDFTLWEYTGKTQNKLVKEIEKEATVQVDPSSLNSQFNEIKVALANLEIKDIAKLNATNPQQTNLSYLPQLSYFPGVF